MAQQPQQRCPGKTADAQQHKGGEGKGGGRHGGTAALSPVQAAEAVRQSVPQYLSGLGTVTAANTVTLRSRVDGDLMALHFTEGQEVKAGQLIAEIDPRPYQVALTQAQGQLAKDQATLANARRDLARYEKLAKTNLVSQQEMDTQRSLVSETLGTIKADEGSVASAQLNLTYSRVTSLSLAASDSSRSTSATTSPAAIPPASWSLPKRIRSIWCSACRKMTSAPS